MSAPPRPADCSGGAPAAVELTGSRTERTVWATFSFLPEPATVMLRVACGIETCKGARLSGLNFSWLLQGDQKVALEIAIFRSSEYPHMSPVQDAGQHFSGLKTV